MLVKNGSCNNSWWKCRCRSLSVHKIILKGFRTCIHMAITIPIKVWSLWTVSGKKFLALLEIFKYNWSLFNIDFEVMKFRVLGTHVFTVCLEGPHWLFMNFLSLWSSDSDSKATLVTRGTFQITSLKGFKKANGGRGTNDLSLLLVNSACLGLYAPGSSAREMSVCPKALLLHEIVKKLLFHEGFSGTLIRGSQNTPFLPSYAGIQWDITGMVLIDPLVFFRFSRI